MTQRNDLLIPYSRRDGPGGVRVDMRVVAFFTVVLALLGLAGWLYLRQASEVAQLANAVREQELRKEDLHRQIVILNAEVAMLGSLKRVLHEGIEMGYQVRGAGDIAGQLSVVCPGCRTPGVGSLAPVPAAPSAQAHEDQGPWQGLLERIRGWVQPWAPEKP